MPLHFSSPSYATANEQFAQFVFSSVADSIVTYYFFVRCNEFRDLLIKSGKTRHTVRAQIIAISAISGHSIAVRASVFHTLLFLLFVCFVCDLMNSCHIYFNYHMLKCEIKLIRVLYRVTDKARKSVITH